MYDQITTDVSSNIHAALYCVFATHLHYERLYANVLPQKQPTTSGLSKNRKIIQEYIQVSFCLQRSFVFPHLQLQSINDTTNLTTEMCKIAISYNLLKAVDNNNNIRDNLRDLANQALDYLISQATIVSIVMLCLPKYIALTVHSYQLLYTWTLLQ